MLLLSLGKNLNGIDQGKCRVNISNKQYHDSNVYFNSHKSLQRLKIQVRDQTANSSYCEQYMLDSERVELLCVLDEDIRRCPLVLDLLECN